MPWAKPTDLTGRTFGSWTVLSYAGKRRWFCRCACGEERSVLGDTLRRGESTKCRPCRNSRPTWIKHGATGTRLYRVWASMKGRVASKDPRYGGRGIQICNEWKNNFDVFRDWALANGYAPGLSIDRINNDGHYEPGNCRWADIKQQARNKRTNVRVEFRGRTGILTDFAVELSLRVKSVEARLRRGWSVNDALTVPLLGARQRR